jgi:hypothetical protein
MTLSEGFFSADRKTKKIYGDDEQSLTTKIQGYLERDKNFEPKSSKIKKDSLGRFYVDYSFLLKDKDSKDGIFDKIGRGINKATEVVKKVVDAIPRQGTLTAINGFKLGQERAKFVKDHPDVVFSKPYRTESGHMAVNYSAKNPVAKKPTGEDRINNIQRALNTLSDQQLKSIEAIIKIKE